MKIGFKRGTTAAVLEAPEDEYASEDSYERPARSGSPRRGYDAGAEMRSDAYDLPDSSPRTSSRTAPRTARRTGQAKRGLQLRLPGLPRTLGGRILAAAGITVTLGILGAATLVVRQYLLHSDRFLLASASDIEIVGNQQLPRMQALGVFAGDLDRNLFHMSLAQREADLERLPWVEHATVMRLLPNRLRVSIVERTPVAYVRQGTQIGLVDASGVLLDMPADAAGNPQYSFPVLTGLSGSDPLSTRKARMELYAEFLKAMSAGGSQVTESLSEVDVTDPEDVKAVVARDNSDIVVHFGQENFLERYRTFEEHLPEWKQAYPKLSSADMRYNNQILLDTGTGNPPAAASATGAVPTATGPSAAEAAAVATALAAPAAGAAAKTPAAKTPAAKIPVAKIPVAKTPVAKTPVAKTPAAKARLAAAKAAAAHRAKKAPVPAHGKPKAANHAGGSTR